MNTSKCAEFLFCDEMMLMMREAFCMRWSDENFHERNESLCFGMISSKTKIDVCYFKKILPPSSKAFER